MTFSALQVKDSTFGQVRDLGNLIEKNDKTHARSEDGLKIASKCVGDYCERILKKHGGYFVNLPFP